MTPQEKESFCRLMACLLCPPDQEIADLLHHGTLHPALQKLVRSWGEEENLLDGFILDGPPETLLYHLIEAYRRLFSDATGERISLVESFYKPWTVDITCSLPFASEKGLLMGDSALHLSTLLQEAGLEVAEEFRGCPDHLVIELEFLAALYRGATGVETLKFIGDHLNWIPLLKEQVKRAQAHPFYVSVLEVLDCFLKEEKKRRE